MYFISIKLVLKSRKKWKHWE